MNGLHKKLLWKVYYANMIIITRNPCLVQYVLAISILFWHLRMQFSPCVSSMDKILDYSCNLVMDSNLWCNLKMTIPVGQFSGWRFPILVKYIDNKSQVIKWWELKFTLLNYWWWDKRCLSIIVIMDTNANIQ